MNSAEEKKPWQVVLAGPAQRSLKRTPRNDHARIRLAIEAMEANPFQGDVRKLQGGRDGFRRRVGDWRIFSTSIPKSIALW
jgi:mRNA-degrading endonuclease RelE of RelBE toxin-antitoxin system